MTNPALQSHYWVLDVDGCLMQTASPGGQGGQPAGRAGEFIDRLKRHGRKVLLCTNASQKLPSFYAKNLRDVGIDIPDADFVTAGSAAAEYLSVMHPNASVLVVGAEGLASPVQRAGLELATLGGPWSPAGVVVCGAADTYSTTLLNAACLSVEAGAPLYVTHDSPWFHGGRGKSVAITAAIGAAISWVTGIQSEVLGKPSPALAATLLSRLGGRGSNITVVGDAPAEIKLAREMKAHSICVLSGALAHDDIPRLEVQPDLVFEDISRLLDCLESQVFFSLLKL